MNEFYIDNLGIKKLNNGLSSVQFCLHDYLQNPHKINWKICKDANNAWCLYRNPRHRDGYRKFEIIKPISVKRFGDKHSYEIIVKTQLAKETI